jgi:hypothetical protein
MTDRRANASHRTQMESLARLSAQVEELFLRASTLQDFIPPELADEIAATAGEIMVELAKDRGDDLARWVIEDARRLREVVRTIHPESARAAEAGRALVCDLQLVIREDKRAA